MLFSSLVFIWYFLPIVFLAYICIPNLKLKNGILLISSLYGIAVNLVFELIINRTQKQG